VSRLPIELSYRLLAKTERFNSKVSEAGINITLTDRSFKLSLLRCRAASICQN